MTREEAKAIVKGFMENPLFSDIPKVCRAFDMAIKALEQESCEDAPDIRIGECEDVISRDDAKSFLYERLNRLNNDELYDIFSVIIDDMYNELPPVQPKSGWIPVSERLPEEEFASRTVYRYPCLVTRKASHDLVSPERTYVAEHYFDGKTFVSTLERDCHKDVIAWMPLPEPYKAELGGEE